jgi:hypothetical protein
MSRIRQIPLWLAVALPALCAQTSTPAQGTIVFVRPAQPIPVVYTSFPTTYDFDVNGDGTSDYHFNLANGLGVTVEPMRRRQILEATWIRCQRLPCWFLARAELRVGEQLKPFALGAVVALLVCSCQWQLYLHRSVQRSDGVHGDRVSNRPRYPLWLGLNRQPRGASGRLHSRVSV